MLIHRFTFYWGIHTSRQLQSNIFSFKYDHIDEDKVRETQNQALA